MFSNAKVELFFHSSQQRPTAAVSAVCTSVKRNANFAKLQAGYLFPEVSVAAQQSLTVTQLTQHILKYIWPVYRSQSGGVSTRRQTLMRASSVLELAIPQSQFLKSLLMLWLMLQLEWQLVKATVGKPCHTSDVLYFLCQPQQLA